MKGHATQGKGAAEDAEVRAIRTMIRASELDAAMAVSKPPGLRSTQSPRMDDPTLPKTPLQKAARPECERRQAMSDRILRRMRAYRPDAGNILATSAVLFAILRPDLLLRLVLAILLLAGVARLVLGRDRFGSTLDIVFGLWTRRFPTSARQAKVRAFVLSRRWNRTCAKLPEPLGRTLTVPDRRQQRVAEARHDTAVCDRLNRLREETAA